MKHKQKHEKVKSHDASEMDDHEHHHDHSATVDQEGDTNTVPMTLGVDSQAISEVPSQSQSHKKKKKKKKDMDKDKHDSDVQEESAPNPKKKIKRKRDERKSLQNQKQSDVLVEDGLNTTATMNMSTQLTEPVGQVEIGEGEGEQPRKKKKHAHTHTHSQGEEAEVEEPAVDSWQFKLVKMPPNVDTKKLSGQKITLNQTGEIAGGEMTRVCAVGEGFFENLVYYGNHGDEGSLQRIEEQIEWIPNPVIDVAHDVGSYSLKAGNIPPMKASVTPKTGLSVHSRFYGAESRNQIK